MSYYLFSHEFRLWVVRMSLKILLASFTVVAIVWSPMLYAQGASSLKQQHPPVQYSPVDWIFLIDTSASMAGHGPPHVDVFPRVLDTLGEFLPSTQKGDSLTVFTFDRESRRLGPDLPELIWTDTDRNRITEQLHKLKPDGLRTHIGAAVKDGLQQYYSRSDAKRPAAIILFTDGVEDIRGIPDPIRIPDAVKLLKDVDLPYVFYVSLGTSPDPQLLNLIEKLRSLAPKPTPRGVFFADPGAKNLAAIGKEIRKLIIPKQPIGVSASILDLGECEVGNKYSRRITFEAAENTKVALSPVSEPADLTTRMPQSVNVSPAKQAPVDLTFEIGKGMPLGPAEYQIKVEPIDPPEEVLAEPQFIDVRLRVERPWISKIVEFGKSHFLVLLLLLLGLILAILYVFRDEIIDALIRWRRTRLPAVSAYLIDSQGEKVTLNQSVIAVQPWFEVFGHGRDHEIHALKRILITEGFGSEAVVLEEGQRRPLVRSDEIRPDGESRTFTYMAPRA